jgi:cell division protein FtsW (lipid II flippase)
MARLCAQLLSLVFGLLGLGGLLVGNADHNSAGNFGSIPLHLTWVRDALDIVLAAAFITVGFVVPRQVRLGRLVVGGAGVLLVLLAAVGFMNVDTDNATRAVAGMHFTTALNILDLVTGVLGVLSALGTLEDEPGVAAAR